MSSHWANEGLQSRERHAVVDKSESDSSGSVGESGGKANQDGVMRYKRDLSRAVAQLSRNVLQHAVGGGQ